MRAAILRKDVGAPGPGRPGSLLDVFAMHDEGSYYCDFCGEEIVVPIDLTAGNEQTYVEDCPVCCNPVVIHVEIDDDGEVSLWGEAE